MDEVVLIHIKRVQTVSVLLLVSLGACQSNNAPVPVTSLSQAATELEWGTTRNVDIDANLTWQSSGLIVLKDEEYAITATGTWSIGAICGYTDANGTKAAPLCSGDPDGIGATGSSLIGRIGPNGKAFKVGTSLRLKPTVDGEFFMRSYDLLPGDNTGIMHVRIAYAGALAGSEKPPRHHDPL